MYKTSMERPPYIVAIGGTLRSGSSTEKALRLAAGMAESMGAEATVLSGPALDLPHYAPDATERTPQAELFVRELRRADGIILGSPVYHGSISGVVKNMLDYVQDTSEDSLPYFKDRAVGIISVGAGWQGAVSTVQALRSMVHALRGWPTPYGLPINTMETGFDADGRAASPALEKQIAILVEEVVNFAFRQRIQNDSLHNNPSPGAVSQKKTA